MGSKSGEEPVCRPHRIFDRAGSARWRAARRRRRQAPDRRVGCGNARHRCWGMAFDSPNSTKISATVSTSGALPMTSRLMERSSQGDRQCRVGKWNSRRPTGIWGESRAPVLPQHPPLRGRHTGCVRLRGVERPFPHGQSSPGVTYIPIDARLTVADDLVYTPENADRLAKLDEHLKKGENTQAIEVLRAGGVLVNVTMALLPVEATQKGIDKAKLVADGKYYEANLAL